MNITTALDAKEMRTGRNRTVQTWLESPNRLHLIGGDSNRRTQLLVALAVLLLVIMQADELNIFTATLVGGFGAWIIGLLLRRSIEVVIDRQFRVVIVRRRDLFGVLSFGDEVFELSQLESIPVASRKRYVAFGPESFWLLGVKFTGQATMLVGTVHGESRRVEVVLNQISEFLSAPLAEDSFRAGARMNIGPQGLLAELLDSEATVRIGQVLCLVMILLSLFAAPGMAIFYLIALFLGTWFDWMARRGDRS